MFLALMYLFKWYKNLKDERCFVYIVLLTKYERAIGCKTEKYTLCNNLKFASEQLFIHKTEVMN